MGFSLTGGSHCVPLHCRSVHGSVPQGRRLFSGAILSSDLRKCRLNTAVGSRGRIQDAYRIVLSRPRLSSR